MCIFIHIYIPNHVLHVCNNNEKKDHKYGRQ